MQCIELCRVVLGDNRLLQAALKRKIEVRSCGKFVCLF